MRNNANQNRLHFFFPCIIGFFIFLSTNVAFASKQNLKFAIVPWDKPEKLTAMYKPLMEYISKKTGQNCQFAVMKDYPDLESRMKNKVVDIGLFTPKTYITAKKSIPTLQYIATHVTLDESGKEVDYYKGYFLTKKDSKFNSINDLKNKNFGFTHKESSSGFAYPASKLKKMGIDFATYFGKVFWLKKHHRVTGAIAAGSIDGGATWDGEYVNAVKKYGDVFKIIDQTKPIPNDPIAAHEGIDPKLVALIGQALDELKQDSNVIKQMKKAGFPDVGFSIRNDSFYDVVRDLAY